MDTAVPYPSSSDACRITAGENLFHKGTCPTAGVSAFIPVRSCLHFPCIIILPHCCPHQHWIGLDPSPTGVACALKETIAQRKEKAVPFITGWIYPLYPLQACLDIPVYPHLYLPWIILPFPTFPFFAGITTPNDKFPTLPFPTTFFWAPWFIYCYPLHELLSLSIPYSYWILFSWLVDGRVGRCLYIALP